MLMRYCAMLAMLLLVPITGPTLSAADQAGASKELRLEVERLAVDYRIAIYSAYRTDRQQYDRCREAWAEVHSAWVASGQREADLTAMATWLRTSIDQAKARSGAAPPAAPAFGAVDLVSQVKGNTETDEVAVSVPTPSQRDRAHEMKSSSTQQTVMPRTFDERARRGSLDRWKETLAERNPPLRARALAPSRRQLDALDLAAPTSQQALHARRVLDHIAFRPQVVELSPTESGGPTSKPTREIAETGIDETRIVTTQPQARINIQELKARSAGYNLGIQGLQGRLQSQQNWSARELAALMIELEDLISRQEDLAPYHALVGNGELTALTSPELVLDRIQAELTATRERLDAGASGNDRRQHDLELLDLLQRRLKELSQEASTQSVN